MFKRGDRVKYNSPSNSAWHDKPGTVVSILNPGRVVVNFDHWTGAYQSVRPETLVLIEEHEPGLKELRALNKLRQEYREINDKYTKLYTQRQILGERVAAAEKALLKAVHSG